MINKIILGTVQLGLDYGVNNKNGKPNIEQAFDILNMAYDNKIRLLDTAEAYGNSQEIIGLFHKKYPNKKFKVISKINPLKLDNNFNVEKQIKENVINLNINHLYTYMFHHYQSLKDNMHIYKDLVHLKNVGLIKKIGISLYTNNELEDVINNYKALDIIQLPFNMFDNASKRKEALIKAKKNGIEIHVRSVFLQGLFFLEPKRLKDKLKSFLGPLTKINEMSLNLNIPINSIALKYVLEKEYIDNVLIGVDSSEQLLKNIISIHKKESIPHQEIDSISIQDESILNPTNWK